MDNFLPSANRTNTNTAVSCTSIEQQQSSRTPGPDLDEARNYVKRIKFTFANQPHVYKQFLEIIHSFHLGKTAIKQIYQQITLLFQDYPDLIAGFTAFLPDPSPPPAPISQPILNRRKVQVRPRRITKNTTSDVVVDDNNSGLPPEVDFDV